MKFKVGDKVKIRENLSLGKHYSVHLSRSMLLNKGKEAKITYISPDNNACHLDIDGDDWWWSEDMLEPYMAEIRKSDLKDGDYCIFKNKERAIKFGGYVIMDGGGILLREYNKKLEHNFNSNYDIVRIDRPVEYETIYKNDEILDSTEKKYLAAVIAPFRDKVKNIAKIDRDTGRQYISICHDDGLYVEDINLPDFKAGTMYVGMKSNKVYTLEELGL